MHFNTDAFFFQCKQHSAEKSQFSRVIYLILWKKLKCIEASFVGTERMRIPACGRIIRSIFSENEKEYILKKVHVFLETM